VNRSAQYSHVSGQSEILGTPVHWWPSEDGGVMATSFLETV